MTNQEMLIWGGAGLAAWYFYQKSKQSGATGAAQPSTAQSAQDGAGAAVNLDGIGAPAGNSAQSGSLYSDWLQSLDNPVPYTNMNALSPQAQAG